MGILSFLRQFCAADDVTQVFSVSFAPFTGRKGTSMKYSYKSVTESITIEVSEEWKAILDQLDRAEESSERQRRRRCLSLEEFEFEGEYFGYEDRGFEKIHGEKSEEERLHIAINKLDEEQRQLVDAIFYKRIEGKYFAKICGRTPGAITQRKATVIKKLKKFFSET